MEDKILGGRYQLIEKIGMGGMAIVYKALDDLLNRYVAVKILREEYKENEEFIRRFKVESQAAACLSHQNIVQIYDVGEEDGINYIIMELLEGVTLKKYMSSKEERLPLREAMNFSMQICRALEHAHSKHVVHRDIKPHNIVLTQDGKIKVADFGIARATNNNTTVDTATFAVGSAHYLSPEQARGGYTDHRSDIYSFGVVMYELFTGQLPFDAEEAVSVVIKHINDEATPPREINPDIPAGIEAIITRAMCKEQRKRYDNATQILEDLVMVYQDPSIDVSRLHACADAGKQEPPARENIKKPSSQKPVKKKKSDSKKGLIIGIATFFIIAIILASLPLWVLIFGTGNEAQIPSLVGMTYEEAAIAVEKASDKDIKFSLFVEEKTYSDEKKDTILSQTPEANLKTKRSREIKLTISLGPVAVELDDYTGHDYIKIKDKLSEKGVSVIIEHEDNDTYDEGKIFKQFPSSGTKLGKGDEVTLYVSKGTENTVVPDVIGKTVDEAIITIERNNLKVSVVEADNEAYLKGEVFEQSITAFTTVPVGTTIEITYSSGKTENSGEVLPDVPPEKVAGPKQVTLTLTSLSKTEVPTKVKIMLDGVRVYEGDVPSTTGSATITFDVDPTLDLSHGVDIYYNDAYRTTKEVQ